MLFERGLRLAFAQTNAFEQYKKIGLVQEGVITGIRSIALGGQGEDAIEAAVKPGHFLRFDEARGMQVPYTYYKVSPQVLRELIAVG